VESSETDWNRVDSSNTDWNRVESEWNKNVTRGEQEGNRIEPIGTQADPKET